MLVLATMSPYDSGTSSAVLWNVVAGVAVNSFAMLLNFFVSFMLFRFRRVLLQNNNNILLFSMSLADFLVGAFGVIQHSLFYMFEMEQKVSLHIWKLYGVLPFFGSMFISVFSLGIMTADRLISVECSLLYASFMTIAKTKVLAIISWLITILIVTLLGLIYVITSPMTELIVRGYLIGTIFIVGESVLMGLNMKLYFIVRQKRRRNSSFCSIYPVSVERISTSSEEPRAKISTSSQITLPQSNTSDKICLWMTIVFTVCWLPIAIYYLWCSSTYNAVGSLTLNTILVSLASTNSVLNPIIYFAMRQNFRDYFKRLYCKCY